MKQVISIFLSVLLLASSTGVTYAKHFCGDFEMIAEVTFGQKDMSCGMAIETHECDEEESNDHNCCANEYTNVDTDDNFAQSSLDFSLDQTITVLLVSTFLLTPVEVESGVFDDFPDSRPPPLIENYTILYESFLI